MEQPSYLTAVILGIVQGITEFLPISSTGHLILVGELLSFEGPLAKTFDIVIQFGSILGVLALYHQRFFALLQFDAKRGVDWLTADGMQGLSGMVKLVVGCFPALLMGALLHGFVKTHLYGALPVASALCVGGIVMILVERKPPPSGVSSLDLISLRQALWVGCFQCLALWPGVSRSGATIVGGLLCGLERKVAAEFSFLLAVPILAAATAYDFLKSRSLFSADSLTVVGVGLLVSAITSVIAIRALLKVFKWSTLAPFGWYRVALSLVVIVVTLL